MKYGWSLDEEHFQGDCDSREAALQEAIETTDVAPGATVFTCEIGNQKGSDFFDVDTFLERLNEAAYDLCNSGEFVTETYPDISEEKKAELEKLIGAWLDENCAPDWWMAENVQRHEVPIPA